MQIVEEKMFFKEMQEQLFKAKRRDNDEWVEGSVVTQDTHGPLGEQPKKWIIDYADEGQDENSLIDFSGYEVDPETVCQYINRKGRDGALIFEGDELRNCAGDSFYVIFDEGCFCLETNGEATEVIIRDWENSEQYEVYGNIHDPEKTK